MTHIVNLALATFCFGAAFGAVVALVLERWSKQMKNKTKKKTLTITLDDLSPGADVSLTVSFREAVYYSRRLQLLQRGVGFHRASSRARLLANYLERRRGREGRKS